MVNVETKNQGLRLQNIDNKNWLVMDPDNVFWGVVGEDEDRNLFIPKKLLSLYQEKRQACDAELRSVRFSTDLSAVYIDPTDRCQANCPYCYIPAKIRTEGQSMSPRELDFVLKKIAAYFKPRSRKPVIIFHAAEPLLVKEVIFAAIEKFKDDFYFGIQTNALLLKKEDADFIKQHKVSMGVSLDAADPAANNRLRSSRSGGGNFDKAAQAIEWFRGYKGLNVITTMTKLNIKGLPSLVRFLHKKGVGCVLINPVRLTQKNSRALRPDEKLMGRYFIRAVRQARECSRNSPHKIIVGNFANTLLGIIAPSARRLMCDISPCGGGRCFLTITADGRMIPCGEFIGIKGFSGGNIFKDSIEQVMKSRPFEQVRSRIVEKIDECKDCLLRNLCGAPCPAELHNLGGMYQKAAFCEFYKTVIAYAFQVIAEGKEHEFLRLEGLRGIEYQYRYDASSIS